MIVSLMDTIYCKCLHSLVTTNIKLMMVLTVTHQYLRKEQGCMQAIVFGGRLELLMKGHIDSVKLVSTVTQIVEIPITVISSF